jgi:DNA-binding NtrC family response regulator
MEKKDFRILVVDDDEIAKDVVSIALSREGYTVISANDGLEAMRILEIEDIDLVLTDLKMPKANGIDVLRYAIKNNPDTAVVILTAYGTLDTAIDAIKEGAYDYLTKPFNIQQILLLTARAFERTVLIKKNRELRKQLRDTYRDLKIINALAESENQDVQANWINRMEGLVKLNILSAAETEMLKDKLLKVYAKEGNSS